VIKILRGDEKMAAPPPITCTVCGSNLMRGPSGWLCPTCGFYFRVSRGKAGAPLLEPPEEVAEEAPPAAPVPPASTETFEEWLEKHGVTAEMYNDADKRTKEDLKTAFYQRHLKDADVTLFPAQ
jgi:predicted RNA-binding Zn-ribbon protein involved in translation (DUF1610 family)